MNWLIRKKMFTCFINKFRRVNLMYYIKCGVNSSFTHNSGCCIRSVAPWITVLSRHTVITKRVIYYKFIFCVIFCKTRHHAQAHITSGALCLFFGRENTDGWVDFARHCYGYFCWGWLLLLFLFFVFLKIVFSHHWLLHLIPRLCQQPEFHWWLPPQVLFIFFRPLLETHNLLPSLDYYVWLGTVSEM